ncbi:MAG: CoA ester lyase [Asticcacaulis sp.]|nr:CoA ester lyase [Asticcacaulis sp.]
MTTRYRSALFVPCGNPRALQKAPGIACDVLIFDLEDAVGDTERDGALAALAGILESEFTAGTLLVRIHPQYLNAIHRALKDRRIDGIVVPKVSGTEDVRGVMTAWPHVPVWAMIETAESVANLWEVAGMPLTGLIAGPNDLRKDLRTRAMAGRQDILFALSQIVLYGRANGLVVLDGVYNQFTDEAGFAAECDQGRSLGFDGKTLIHPSQIALCEAAFGPSQAEIAWARAVVAAFEGSDAGVISVDGEMVERLHLDQAREILKG